MKCDRLKVYVPQDGPYGLEPEEGGEPVEEETCYLKSDVDASIDELKSAHHKERHEYIKMIAELKQKLEDAKATAYAESVDAGMENRRLKRELWLARALRARDKAFEYHFKNNVEMCAKLDNVHLMLMAKAEEYK